MTTHIVISPDRLEEIIIEAYEHGYDKRRYKPIHVMLPSGWLPIADAPKDGTWVLVAGPSGYTSSPIRIEVCRFIAPHWRNHADNLFTDGGDEPTHFLPLVTPIE